MIVCADDFKIDLLAPINYSEELVEQMTASGMMQQVTLPTRMGHLNSKSLIDHVHTPSKRTLRTDVVATDISDNFMTN